jgi:hypothetical protein
MSNPTRRAFLQAAPAALTLPLAADLPRQPQPDRSAKKAPKGAAERALLQYQQANKDRLDRLHQEAARISEADRTNWQQILLCLQGAIDHVEDHIEEHGETCDCKVCEEAPGMLWSLRLIEGVFWDACPPVVRQLYEEEQREGEIMNGALRREYEAALARGWKPAD